MSSNILATRDNKGKIRIASISMEIIENGAYVIKRATGLYGGKQTSGPEIIIEKGKAKRTIAEQAELQFKALLKEYRDKGYVDINTAKPLEEQVPTIKKDTNGSVKPMLCKVIDWEDKKLLGKKWLVERKYDGLRVLLYCKDGKIHTASRGGQDYDIAAQHIINDPVIISLFKANPSIILDGELYRHGWHLEKISGLGRLDSRCEDHNQLAMHVYDIVDEDKTCKERYDIMDRLKADFMTKNLVFVPYWTIEPQTDLKCLKTIIMGHHDRFVNDGYEGAVIRDVAEKYKCGGRDRRMLKIKCMTTNEYKIVGLSEGLREEDMAFELVTPEGYPFKAKPEGDRALKHWYHEHINELIGKMMTVRYFHMSNTEHPVPTLPVALAIRDKKDMD